MPRTAILDVDGTLVDTNYHHTIAWYRAFAAHDIVLPIWRIHRHIGMGGDQLVAALAGADCDEEMGDAVRAAEKVLYGLMIHEVRPMPGAARFVKELTRRGVSVVLASSAKQEELDHYLGLLDVAADVDSWTTSADVEATKPEPDLVRAALDKSAGDPAVMVGDSTWDCEAAKRAGIESLGVLTGGFSETELRDSGAATVYTSVEELVSKLDDTPLA